MFVEEILEHFYDTYVGVYLKNNNIIPQFIEDTLANYKTECGDAIPLDEKLIIAHSAGLESELITKPLLDTTDNKGLMFTVKNHCIILVDNNLTLPEQRITALHELAHTLFYKIDKLTGKIVPVDGRKAWQRNPAHKYEEMLCEQIAMELLMPDYLVREKIDQNLTPSRLVKTTAKKFLVPTINAAYRLWQLKHGKAGKLFDYVKYWDFF